MKAIWTSLILVGTLLTPLAAHAQTGMVVKFTNQRSDASTLPLYITFGGGGTLTATNLANNQPITKGTSYPMASLSGGVQITQFDNGRIFLSLGSPLTTATSSNGYSPNFNNPTLADFSTRWDKVEITFDPIANGNYAGGANLSSQDFFGIPLQIVSSGGGTTPANLTWREGTAEVMQAIGALSNFAEISDQNATGAIACGNNGVAVSGVCSNNGLTVIRVIAPATVAPTNSQGDTVYPSLAPYITYLRTGNNGGPIQTIIQGNNGQIGNGGPFQVYDLVATIYNSSTTIGTQPISSGDLVLNGTLDNGNGAAPFALYVAAKDLSDTAVFGANPSFKVILGSDSNNVGNKVIADYFSAINFGFAGSSVDNPAQTGSTIGNSPSWTWYGNDPTGTDQQPLLITQAFAFAQPTQTFYNQYAAYLTGVSDAYGFAYNDRLQSPLAPLAGGSTMTINVLPDELSLESESSGELATFNDASRQPAPPVAAGSIAIISGDIPVGSSAGTPGNGAKLQERLDGVTVQFSGGQYAPLFSVSPTQAIVQIPLELVGKTEDTIVVTGPKGVTPPQVVQLAPLAPGIFSTDGSGGGQGQIFDQARRLADASHPAPAGSIVSIYCTGLGPVADTPPTGAATLFPSYHPTLTKPSVTIGGMAAEVLSSELAPGTPGLYVVVVRVPELHEAGPAIPVFIQTGGAFSNSVTMGVREGIVPARGGR